jgi:hypothetical protein
MRTVSVSELPESVNDELRAVAFSLDGTLLAPGGHDKQIYLRGAPH